MLCLTPPTSAQGEIKASIGVEIRGIMKKTDHW
jgi:hypothetical protein